MSTCPNKNLPEWKTLEDAVGTFEAYRDYLETDGEIRTPEVVQAKLDKRDGILPMAREQYEADPALAKIGPLISYSEYLKSGFAFIESTAEGFKMHMDYKKEISNHIEFQDTVGDIADNLMLDTNKLGIDKDSLDRARAFELVDKMSQAMGIEYELVSPEDAVDITKDAVNPWSGEGAFFFGGKVYFIQDRLSVNNVFHEFSHPVVRAIAKENNPLFNKLYNDLVLTQEGIQIAEQVRQDYPELDTESDLFKEEVIVKALEKAGIGLSGTLTPDGKFAKFIQDLLYAIKQFFRAKFGRAIPISGLSPNTTLGELAEILSKGDKIEFNKDLISDEEIVAYNKEIYKEVVQELDRVDHNDIQKTVNEFYNTIEVHLNTLYTNQNYEELAELLTDEFHRGDLQEMKSNLKAWQDTVKKNTENLMEDVNESKKRVKALTNTLFRLELMTSKIRDHVMEVSTRPDTQENMHQAYYYDHFIKNWIDFIDDLNERLTENNVDGRSAVKRITTNILEDMKISKKKINKMYAEGARDSIYEQLLPMQEHIAEKYVGENGMITKLENMRKPGVDNPALEREIDRLYKEYHGMTQAEFARFEDLAGAVRLTEQEEQELQNLTMKSAKGLSVSKEKIEQLLKGEMGDVNYLNSYLEGYLYNTDPIVGGLALYVKNALANVMIVTQQKYNDFAEDMRDDLEAIGVNSNNLGSLGEKVYFKDTIVARKPDGTLERKEVLTFLNEFKNHRADYDEKRIAQDQAYSKWHRSNSDEDYRAYIAAKVEFEQFKNNYYHQEYVEEFYNRRMLFEQDEIGKRALFERDKILEEIRIMSTEKDPDVDQDDVTKAIEAKWREYRQLHSMLDLNGNPKSAVPDQYGISPADISKRLREYREASREFYEERIREGVFENAYLNFVQALEAEDGMVKGSDEWYSRLDAWKKKNTRVAIKPEFYEQRNKIIAEIKTILSKLPNSVQKDVDQTKIWEEIFDLTAGFKDEDSQIQANEMTQKALDKIKVLQEELKRMKEDSAGINGLTKQENQVLSNLTAKSKKQQLTTAEAKTRTDLLNKIRTQGLNKFDKSILFAKFEELAEMSTYEPTDYYLDIVNNFMGSIDEKTLGKIKKKYKLTAFTKANAYLLLEPGTVTMLRKASPDFAKWFDANHMEKVNYDPMTQIQTRSYERIYAWNTVKPTDESMMESVTIQDKDGNIIDTIAGKPGMEYYARVVKNKYKTRNLVGVTKDNRGNYLPKSRALMAKNTRLSEADKYKYINEEYERIQREDPKLFKVISKLTRHHLKNQEGLDRASKLYLDAPRFGKNELEKTLTTVKSGGKDKYNVLTYWAKRIKEFFKGSAEDAEYGTRNHNARRFNIIRADIFDNEITDIPISGLYDIDINDVSRDVTLSMMRYMMSAERQKQLVKISPVVRAIQESVNNPSKGAQMINELNKKNMKNRFIARLIPKGNDTRKKVINNFIEREFEGKTRAGFTQDNAFLNNFANVLFKRASFAFFALNIPSALKNSLGFKFQAMIEASAGDYIDHINLQKGNLWSYKAMSEISLNVYDKGAKPYHIQLVEAFDMIQGRFEEKFGQGMSRSISSDMANLSWLYSPRKWVEGQASLQLASGILYKVKVDKAMGDTKETIDYIDAFEIVNNQLQLKEGIDVRYGLQPVEHVVESTDTIVSIAAKYHTTEDVILEALRGKNIQDMLVKTRELEMQRDNEISNVDIPGPGANLNEVMRAQDRIDAITAKYQSKIDANTIKIDNSKFKFYRNRMHQVSNNMSGAYAKYDQPEMQRYLLFRMVSFLRRYFTAMAVNRWGFAGPVWDPKPRLNPGLGDAQMGYYTQSIKTIMQTIGSLGAHAKYASPEEKRALLKFSSEVGMLILAKLMISVLFGFEPDDDDRFAKLRAKTGPLGLFGASDENREFDMFGFLEVHALHLLMQIRSENEQFNPLTGGLKQYNSLLDFKSVALGPTTDTYMQLGDDLAKWFSGDPRAYYTRDIGPYQWQKQESLKFSNHFAKMFGLTGSSLDPALAIQNFQAYQSKIR